MAYKVFSNGDALTGSELNTYLMNQSVISFATATARDAALPSPSEGQLVWLEDSNKYVYYTGSAWADLITPASSGNFILNSAFDIWQRGTSFTNPADSSYLADRFTINYDGSGATRVLSQQAFTAGSAPVAGYESAFFLRHNQTVAGTSGTYQTLGQKIEDARTLAGQTATISFWAKADAARTLTLQFHRNYGTGGSSADFNILSSAPSFSVTTSWVRYSATVSIPAVTGETIGTGSFLWMILNLPLNVVQTIDIWGVQVESGSSATAFKRNASNIQGELAACQRYYYRASSSGSNYGVLGTAGIGISGTLAANYVQLPVTMRTTPSAIDYSGTLAVNDATNSTAITGITLSTNSSPTVAWINPAVSSGLTQYRPYQLISLSNSTVQYIGFSAEL